MLLVGSIIAYCWGENRVKERDPASWALGWVPGPNPKVAQGIQHSGWEPGMQSWVCLVG